MFGGWAFMCWAAMQVWGNIQDILKDHYQYILGYFIATGKFAFDVHIFQKAFLHETPCMF